jgi:uncharacterized protein (DUF2267 family)
MLDYDDFITLRRAVGPDEFTDLRSELPRDFEPLLDDALREPVAPPAGHLAVMSAEEFVGRVADRAVLDVLREALGEDEFHDTTAQLPGEYRVLLRRR